MSLIPHHTSDATCALCEQKLSQVHPDLSKWFRDLKSRHPMVHISWGYRDEASQSMAFQFGATRLKFPDSAHNKEPAMAVDIFQIDASGRAVFNPIFCAKVNDESLRLGYALKWGGQWKSLGDTDHFELTPNNAGHTISSIPESA